MKQKNPTTLQNSFIYLYIIYQFTILQLIFQLSDRDNNSSLEYFNSINRLPSSLKKIKHTKLASLSLAVWAGLSIMWFSITENHPIFLWQMPGFHLIPQQNKKIFNLNFPYRADSKGIPCFYQKILSAILSHPGNHSFPSAYIHIRAGHTHLSA